MYPQDLCGLARLLNAEQVLANIKMQQQTKKKTRRHERERKMLLHLATESL